MKKVSAIFIGLLVAATGLTASAAPGEKVDFNAQIIGVQGNGLMVRQAETGVQWMVSTGGNYRHRNRQGYYVNGYSNNFQVGQVVHVLGTQTAWNRIRADDLQPSYTYNQYPPSYQGNQYDPRYQQGYNNNNQQGYNQQGYNQQGYNQQGYNQQGYNQQGYNQQGYNQPGYANGGLSLTNPPQGVSVPPNFNVQGQAAPYSQIQVAISGQRVGSFGVNGQADANGHFDIPIQANNRGQLHLNVTAVAPNGQQSQPIGVDVVRQ